MKFRHYLVISLASWAALACAAAPPLEDYLAAPKADLAAAIAAGAEEHSPVDLRFAKEKLEAATLAMEASDHALGQRLAAQSRVDSELALARAEAAKARRANMQMERRNQALRAELDQDR